MNKAVIFDLDGVIVSTDEYHYLAWKDLADKYDIYFDREINQRLRGVSRMESLEIILEKAEGSYTAEEKLRMTDEKNSCYVKLLEKLSQKDILPGVSPVLEHLKAGGILIAIGSSSRNAVTILRKTGLFDFFDAVADGNQILRSKPDPEVFLLAASMLGVNPSECTVIEDASAGIDAARAAGMKAVGVGIAADYGKSDLSLKSLDELKDIKTIL